MRKLFLFTMVIPAALLASCDANKGTQKEGNEGTEQQAPVIQNIGQSEALPMLNDTNVVTIDVRTPGEVLERYIDGADLFIDVNGDFKSEIAKLDKSKTYLVYCQAGGRSSTAAKMMEAEGFTSIYNLSGGISSWSGPVKP
ncbi:MAG: rhodanese-like domain-containing protein [Bacteroidia bacterium]